MALFRFKSRETGDLIMLEAHGTRILEIIGKDPGAAGVILPKQMSAAKQSLHDAVLKEEADQQRQREEANAKGDPPPEFEAVGLRMRSAPFLDMLHRCEKSGVEIVWGV